MELRGYQKQYLKALKEMDDIEDAVRYINANMPIGSGKSIVITKYIHELKKERNLLKSILKLSMPFILEKEGTSDENDMIVDLAKIILDTCEDQ